MTESPEARRAFNLGADARLAGRSLAANPYEHLGERVEYRLWKRGWEDVAGHWGDWNPEAKPLPAVERLAN